MKEIILDTNFLLIPYEFKVDIFAEIDRICDSKYELCIFCQTIDELKKIIKEQKGKNSIAARLALSLIKQKSLKILNNSESGYVDDSILKYCNRNTIVATQDKELKNKLKEKEIKIIFLRNKKYLEII